MIFLLQEEIDDYEQFSKWFNGEAEPQIEAAGGKVLIQGVEADNENMLHLVMETPDPETVGAFMSDEAFTAARIAAGPRRYYEDNLSQSIDYCCRSY